MKSKRSLPVCYRGARPRDRRPLAEERELKGVRESKAYSTCRNAYVAGAGSHASGVASDRRTRARIVACAHSIPCDDHARTLAGVVASCSMCVCKWARECACMRVYVYISMCAYIVCACKSSVLCVCV
jgi:hypothetical protein